MIHFVEAQVMTRLQARRVRVAAARGERAQAIAQTGQARLERLVETQSGFFFFRACGLVQPVAREVDAVRAQELQRHGFEAGLPLCEPTPARAWICAQG